MSEHKLVFQRDGPRWKQRRDRAWRLLHLAVLSSFALAEPLFSLLGDNPEFFAARGSSTLDIITFATLLTVLPPLVLWACELAVGALSRAAERVLHLVFVGVLVALIATPALKKAVEWPAGLTIVSGVAIGVVVAVLYQRTRAVKLFVNVLSPAPVIFLVAFLVVSPVSRLLFPDDVSAQQAVGMVAPAPVVMVSFDELPSTSLLDRDRRIDPVRYPAFAALAADATWYRNAVAVYDSTTRALPAIVDGNYPSEGGLPTAAEHPRTLFTLLGKSHRMNVSEEATSLCPTSLCEDERADESLVGRLGSMGEDMGLVYAHVVAPDSIERELPSVSQGWGNFAGDSTSGDDAVTEGAPASARRGARFNLDRGRVARFEEWVSKVEAGQRPALNFKHVLLPHVPWQYLPDGRQYRRTANDVIPGLSDRSYGDEGQIEHLYQRHLLQLGLADHELGKLLERLKQLGIYDNSLIVVVADHGLSIRKGLRDRRTITRPLMGDITPIPLIVKAPGQRAAKIDNSYVETVDVLPTMAQALGIKLPWKVDGDTADSPKVRSRREVTVIKRDFSGKIEMTASEFEQRKAEALRRKLKLFGSRHDGPGLYGLGPNRDLVGQRIADLPVTEADAGSAELTGSGDYNDVDLRSPFVPTYLTGQVDAPDGAGRDLAFAVNGRVAAVSRSFELIDGSDELFAALMAPTALRQGRNTVGIYAVERHAGRLTLSPLTSP